MSGYSNVQQLREDLNAGRASELVAAVPLTSGALATFNGPTQENQFWLGTILIVTTSTLVGAGTWKPSIQMLLPDGSTWTNLWQAGAVISTATTTLYAFYSQSGLTDIIATEKKNIAIPRRWRIQMTYGGNGTTDTMAVRADNYMLP